MQGDAVHAGGRADVAGLVFASSAFLLWGFLPLYLKLLDHIPAWEVLAHRAIWAVPTAAIAITMLAAWRGVASALSRPRTRWTLAATAAIMAVNWLTYIWAIANERVLEAALGYFICPLFSVALGVVALGERMTRVQAAAFVLILAGVANQTLAVGEPPFVAVILAISFAVYGLLRKRVDADATAGFFVETLFMAPFALGAILWIQAVGVGSFLADGGMGVALLMVAGPVTAVPLIFFALGARRLNLSTVGLMQYMGPHHPVRAGARVRRALHLGARGDVPVHLVGNRYFRDWRAEARPRDITQGPRQRPPLTPNAKTMSINKVFLRGWRCAW